MVALMDSIKIKENPEKIFNALIKIFSTEKYYKMWHKGHTICKWLKGKQFEKGSILYAEEYLHGKLHKMKFIGTNLVRNKKVEFKLLFPTSLFCPKGSFIIEQGKEHSIFTANLYFRFSRFFNKYAKDRVDAVKRHMKEEGENLKKIVENKL